MKLRLPRADLLVDVTLLVGALVLQQTLARWIAIDTVRPDLTLIALTAVALRRGPVGGLYAGFFLGVIQDVYAVSTLGAGILAKSIVGYALGFFEDRVMKVMAATRMLLLAAAIAVHDIAYFAAAGSRGTQFWEAMWRHSLPSAVYTLVLGGVLFYLAAGFRSREPDATRGTGSGAIPSCRTRSTRSGDGSGPPTTTSSRRTTTRRSCSGRGRSPAGNGCSRCSRGSAN
jgi:rod shape-determining protein MreD